MHILVIGASGMAGHMITTYFKEKGNEVDTISHTHPYDAHTTLMNVCDANKLQAYFNNHTYDVIINCAGALIKDSSSSPTKAILLNAYFPHLLEQLFDKTPTKIIHLSTDCVFSGLSGPYDESHNPESLTYYGKTKALGEINNTKDLTFRMSIIGPDLSPSGVGLLNWFLQQQQSVYGFTSVRWNGITTLELAKAIEDAITQDLSGLYHLTPPQDTSKYELLCLFKQFFNCHDLTVAPKEVLHENKVLINHRTDFTHKVPSYPEMLTELRYWMLQHLDLYPHYPQLKAMLY